MTNIFDTSWKNIYNYFINTQININDEDDYKTKLTKYLLKYKRIIGLVLLIILLIIGYYNENYKNYENYENYNNQTQKGGAGLIGIASKLSLTDIKKAKGLAEDAKSISNKAKHMKTGDNIHDKVGNVLSKGVSGNIKSGLKGTYNVGAAGAQSIRENADWFYGMVYAIALSLAICIITIPSIAFFIVGIICYFLLKDNIKSIKGF